MRRLKTAGLDFTVHSSALWATTPQPLKGPLALVERGLWRDGGQAEAYWMGTCGCVPASWT